MYLGVLGITMMVLVLAAIISNKVHPVVAMIVIPAVVCLIAGHGKELGAYVTDGLKGVSTTATMFCFSVMFFGVITDAGAFDPIISRILKLAGGDPLKIVMGTALLAMVVHLDGSGVVTFMITIPAMMPLYDKLGMRRMTLALVAGMSAGVMNMLPWGGPTMRAITSLNSSVPVMFNPMIIGMAAGMLSVLALAYVLGRQERARVKSSGGASPFVSNDVPFSQKTNTETNLLKRPGLFWVNILLVLATVISMLMNWLPTHLAFMIAFCIALMLNYPNMKEQGKRMSSHAANAMLMASIIFASGVLNGILAGTGMSDGITHILLAVIPSSMGRFIPIILGLISVPMTFIVPVDAYYYGIIPILSHVTSQYGLAPEMVARGSLVGHSTVGFPLTPMSGASVLLVGMTELSWGEYQRKGMPIAIGISWIMLLVLTLTGAVFVW